MHASVRQLKLMISLSKYVRVIGRNNKNKKKKRRKQTKKEKNNAEQHKNKKKTIKKGKNKDFIEKIPPGQ